MAASIVDLLPLGTVSRMARQVPTMTCELCGVESRDVHSGLALYASDGQFERLERCVDHQLCRDRLEATGEEWPIQDLTYSKKAEAQR